jgi:hypothetical protein
MMTGARPLLRRIVALAAILILMAALYAWAPLLTRQAETVRLMLRIVFALWLLLFCVQLVRIVLFVLAEGGNAPPIVTALYQNGVIGTLWEIYRRQAFREARLSVLFLVWGSVIMGIVAVIAYTGKVDESEVLLRSASGSLQDAAPSPTAGIFLYITRDNNPTHYLRDLAGLVTTLKAMGARVVVAEEPFLDMPTSFHQTMLDSIRRSGVVVLYGDWRSGFYPPETFPGQSKLSFVPEVRFSSSVQGVPPSDLRRAYHWYPSIFTGVYLMTDVSLAVAARFLGEPDTLRPICQPDKVIFGGLTIPVRSDGQALSLLSQRVDRAFLNIGTRRELDSDTMKFYSFRDGKAYETFPPEFASEVRDRIVIIDWIDGHPAGGRAIVYVNILESLLRGQVVRVYERLTMLLTAGMIALAGLFCFKIRLRVAVSVVLGLGIMLYLGSIWALSAHYVMLNMAYPTIAAFLSAAIFPLVRLSHEHP